MLRTNLWNKSVPRVELDQRARDARLRLEQLERLLAPRAAAAHSWLRRVVCLFSFASLRLARRPNPGAAEQSAAFPHAQNS